MKKIIGLFFMTMLLLKCHSPAVSEDDYEHCLKQYNINFLFGSPSKDTGEYRYCKGSKQYKQTKRECIAKYLTLNNNFPGINSFILCAASCPDSLMWCKP